MVNTCVIKITSGQNEGKLCKDVHKTCRHKVLLECPNCKFTSRYKNSYSRHIDRCKNTKPKAMPRKKVVIKQKKSQVHESIITDPVTVSAQTLNKLVNKIDSLENHIKSDDKPTTQIINNYNISVMAPNFFSELEYRFGRERAVEILVIAAANNKPLDVLRELYFQGDPNEYPIASRNGRYRYLNDTGDLVESNEGMVSALISTKIQKAMSYATGKLIKNMVRVGDVDSLFDAYDLDRIQDNIYNFPLNFLVSELGSITENRFHPFFMEGVVVINVESDKQNLIN